MKTCNAICWIGGHGPSYGPPARKFICTLAENHNGDHDFGQSAIVHKNNVCAFETAENSRNTIS